MKPQTIRQYHIMVWIRRTFFIEELDIEFISRSQIRITDENGDSWLITCTTDNKDSIEIETI